MIPVSRPSIGAQELAAVREVFDTGWLGLGATTAAFEGALSQRFAGRQVVAVNTGSSALHVALAASGIGPGDEVMVPSLTFAASVQAIVATGATPVFCESHEETLLMDIDDTISRLTPNTKAIMPVHYCGQACDMDRLLALAGERGLLIVEDAAHAFGSTCRGRPIGSFGHLTCFSFDPIKTITCGEGGAVVVEDGRVADRMRRMRLLGIDRDAWQRSKGAKSWSYEVTDPGFRYHMPNFCAAIGLTQLDRLEEIVAKRRGICRRYDEAFHRLRVVRLLKVDYAAAAPQLYIVKVPGDARDGFMAFLQARGVGTGVHYLANHRQPFFAPFARGPLPRAEQVAEQIVSLPLFTDMTDEEVCAVICAVTAWDQQAADSPAAWHQMGRVA
ncbi:MAG: DegT/DnrJ/EryC1/StrS family aminotransferase [Candidatus Omnitrophica bacterium]|nr:DegT/DnrJ/EryC1/StrS family aminotransferase [Candidatus Omnitrophota bacterium]